MNDNTHNVTRLRRLNDRLLYSDEQLANLRLMIKTDTPIESATQAVDYFRRMVGLKAMTAAPTAEEQANACGFLDFALPVNDALVGAELLFKILCHDLTDDQVARLLLKLVRDLNDPQSVLKREIKT
jgi:hypothetical protein